MGLNAGGTGGEGNDGGTYSEDVNGGGTYSEDANGGGTGGGDTCAEGRETMVRKGSSWLVIVDKGSNSWKVLCWVTGC